MIEPSVHFTSDETDETSPITVLSWPKEYIRSTINHSESILPMGDCPESQG